ncbi:MAG: protein kinase [Ignavibacteriales bacterium]|nr:protein kinase [Ignavibacteriales bacterium]
MIGQTISHFRILEKLGEGGMGVVYKAHDTKLDRDVALKFLPHHLSATTDEQARFLQEARAASALNHPSICTIHAIEEESGQQFIVMEYIEGGTLREKLPYAKIDDALNVALQIGEALQEAHAKGIVHRDIKADNIMLTSKGQAKVMDFGLAKLKGSLKLTRTSSTVGTLAYMAPEQIQGGEVDARSDIFSFGVLLFEILTGHLPFRGEHEAAMVYSIVNEDPENIQKYVPSASPELQYVIKTTLEKSPEDRYQQISDVVRDLRRLTKQTSRVVRSTTGYQIPQQPSGDVETQEARQRAFSPRKKTILSIASIAVVLAVVVGVITMLSSHGGVELNPSMTQRVLEVPFTNVGYPGLSADGIWAVFPAADARGKWDIYLMNTSSGEHRRITYDSSESIDIGNVDLSPDGSAFVYYVAPGGKVAKVFTNSTLGGVRRLLADSAYVARYQPDGRRVFFMRGSNIQSKSGKLEIWSIKPDGIDERLEFIDSISVRGTVSLSVSPDGKSVVWLRTFPEGNYQEAVVHNLATGKERQVTFDKKNIDEVCWTRNDQIIYSSNKSGRLNLWMVPAEGGAPVQITKGIGPDNGMKISSDGKKLLYFQSQQMGDIWISDLEGRNPKQLSIEGRMAIEPAISPDGNSIAVSLSTGNPLDFSVFELYVMNRDGSSRQQLTRSNSLAVYPRWSPDGKRLAFTVSQISGGSAVNTKAFVFDMANPGKPVEVGRGVAMRWQDQNELLVFDSTGTWRYSLDSSGKKELLDDAFRTFPLPGNQYVLRFSETPGKEGAWLSSMDKKKEARRLLDGKLTEFRAAPNGKFLLWARISGEFWRISLPDGKRERLPITISGINNGFSVRQDGKEIVYAVERNVGKLVMIENLFK